MANYTTATEVRQESGLVGNANIVDATHINPLIEEAHAELQGRISARYNLAGLSQNFDGSQAEDILGRIETLLTAGYLLQREYPQEQGSDESEGDARIQRAMDLIDAILSGKLKLLDSNGNEYGLVGSGRSGLSIATTVPARDDSERPAGFSIHQQF